MISTEVVAIDSLDGVFPAPVVGATGIMVYLPDAAAALQHNGVIGGELRLRFTLDNGAGGEIDIGEMYRRWLHFGGHRIVSAVYYIPEWRRAAVGGGAPVFPYITGIAATYGDSSIAP